MIINEALGIGNNYDATILTKLGYSRRLSREELEVFFEAPACKKVISYKPLRMAQVWGHVQVASSSNQSETKYENFFDKLKPKFEKSQILANLYGGACLVRDIENSGDLDTPLRLNKNLDVSKISYKGPFDRWEIYPDSTVGLSGLYDDLYNPEFYCYTSQKQGFKKIHKSRIIRFRGAYLPPKLLRENNYWEESLLNSFIPAYLRYNLALISISNSLRRFNLPVFHKENLEMMKPLELDSGGLSIEAKMRQLVQDLSSAKGLTMDKLTEDLTFPSQNNYASIQEILTTLKEEMIADSGLTKPQFYQEFPSGLAATGESERIQEAADLTNTQDSQWGNLIQVETDLITIAFGDKLEDTKWVWNDSYFETPTNKQKTKTENATMDQIYFNMGVLSANEIRSSRFNNPEYGTEIILENTPNLLEEKSDKKDDETSEEKNSPSEKFYPEGDVLPESDYEELSPEELVEIEEDYE